MTQTRTRSGVTIQAASSGAGPFRIQAAAELCGIPAATLRAWERRYGVPVPRRTASAYRLYTPEDVELLARMRDLVEEGVAPAEAARVVLGSRAPVSEEEHAPVDGLELAQERILAATQRWDASAIDTELTRLSMLLDAQTLFERVVAPMLVEIGRRWERGEVSIAQEHLLSERLELAVRASLRALERHDGPLVLLACVDFEQHVIGMLGAALRFAASGARTTVLGAMTPPPAIGEAVRSMAPRMVGLSVSVAPPAPKVLFRAYGKACGSTPWVVGGAAAESVRAVVEAAGGVVASGTSSQWSPQIRDWLRSPR
jgi:MerR family transcriptional regulator, light-induced transcriptional regulator